ncbi:hypothetical protein AAVH_43752, partial [Aphelenchoides avenae]
GTTTSPLNVAIANHVYTTISLLNVANADHVNAAILQLSAANENHSYAAILSVSDTNRLIIAFAIISIFVVLVVAAHAFRPHRPSRSHRPSCQLVNKAPDAADALQTSSVAKNNVQLTTDPSLCSIEYPAATSRHRCINVLLHGQGAFALVDTGAEVSTARPSLVHHLQLPFDANHTSSYATTSSGGLLSFYGTVTTTVSFARHLLQLRLLVAATDILPAPLIIGLDILSALTQPVSFDFINNVLHVDITTIQLYEMPPIQSARKFVPSSFGKLLRVPSLTDANYTSTSTNSASPPTYDYVATTMHSTATTPSTYTIVNTSSRQPTTVIATFKIATGPLLVFRANSTE